MSIDWSGYDAEYEDNPDYQLGYVDGYRTAKVATVGEDEEG